MSVKTASTDNGHKDLDFFLVFSGSIFPLFSSKDFILPFTSLKAHSPLLVSFFLCTFQQQEKPFTPNKPQITVYEKLQQGGCNSTKLAVAYIKWG